MQAIEPKAAMVSPQEAQPKFPLMPLNTAAYSAALAAFGDVSKPVDQGPASLEYMVAFDKYIADHHIAGHYSLGALEGVSQPVASYMLNGDLREFYVTREFIDDVASHVAQIIGQPQSWWTIGGL